MKAYKGFDNKLKCRDFQYEIGKEYKEDKAKVCSCGFHSCLNPMDVFCYYAPTDANGNLNRFCEVEIPEKMDKSDEDSKVATKSIKIGAEIGLKGLIEAGVDFIMEKVDWDNSKETNTGYRSAATNTGDGSAASVEGEDSIAIATGYEGRAKGALGCYIVVAERDDEYKLLDVKAVKVDGEVIKADTCYMLVNSEFVEVEE